MNKSVSKSSRKEEVVAKVEAKAAVKPAKPTKVEEVKPVEPVAKPAKSTKSAAKPVEEAKPVETPKAAEPVAKAAKPTKAAAKPVEEAKPVEAPKVAEEVKAAESAEAEEKRRRDVSRETVDADFDALVEELSARLGSISAEDKKTGSAKFLRTIIKRVKTLKSDVSRIAKQRTRGTRQSNTSSGFMKPVKISGDMASFTGWQE
jgi:hypothetical protein